jgi:hypothetical protein
MQVFGFGFGFGLGVGRPWRRASPSKARLDAHAPVSGAPRRRVNKLPRCGDRRQRSERPPSLIADQTFAADQQAFKSENTLNYIHNNECARDRANDPGG